MAKKKALSLRAERKRLLENCDELIRRFRVTSSYLRVGEAAAAAMQSQTPTVVTSEASSQTMGMPSAYLGPPEILTLVQAAMIQEWQVYLDTLFVAVVTYLLKIRGYSRVPSQMIDIKDIDADSLVKMRLSVATAAKERFSFQAYDQKVLTLCAMFGISGQDDSIAELRKQVEIRNVFQHNRGIVRASDVARIGKTHFEIRDAKSANKYTVGDRIVLTIYEVEHLKNTLETFSERFEAWR